jgi:hypothetical protein
MPLLDKIRDLIGTYYDGELDSHQFREQFAVLFTESDAADSETENLAIQIEGYFADYVEGHLAEKEFKEKLFNLAPSIRLQVNIIASAASDDPAYRYFQFGSSGNASQSPPTQSRVGGSYTAIADPHLTPCFT